MTWAGADWQDDYEEDDAEMSCPHCGAGFDQQCPRETDPAYLECEWTKPALPLYEP